MCDQNSLVENEEEFYLDPVVVLENWHGVLNNITKLMYKNAYLTNAQLRKILESEMCMKIENANWDSWKDVD